MSQHVVDHRGERLRIGGIKAPGHRSLANLLRIGGKNLSLIHISTLLLFRGSRKRSWIAVAFWTTLAIPLLLWVAPSLDRAAQSRLWRGFSLLGSRDSIYGNLTVTVTGDIRSLYDNGAILANAPDPGAAEEAVHYALLEHAAPRRVLLIGGGVKGSIAEVLKHPTVERVDYVEMDPAIIAMARRFFPAQVAPIASDPRVRVHYADGRAYLMTARDSFDVIVLDCLLYTSRCV